MRILGIDPGMTKKNPPGWAVIHDEQFVAAGVLPIPPIPDWFARIGQIGLAIGVLVAEWQPDGMAVEGAHVEDNVQTALKLEAVVGMVGLLGAQHRVPCVIVQPTQAKEALCGDPCADKSAMRTAVRQQFQRVVVKDAADAVGIALAGRIIVREHMWLAAVSEGGMVCLR